MAARARSPNSFGENVRRIRNALGLTQKRVAKKVDLDPTYISGIERGLRNPSLLIISRLAKALGVPVTKLCEGVRE
jgi:transcriptional regulator with XRE-family HTH domain